MFNYLKLLILLFLIRITSPGADRIIYSINGGEWTICTDKDEVQIMVNGPGYIRVLFCDEINCGDIKEKRWG